MVGLIFQMIPVALAQPFHDRHISPPVAIQFPGHRLEADRSSALPVRSVVPEELGAPGQVLETELESITGIPWDPKVGGDLVFFMFLEMDKSDII